MCLQARVRRLRRRDDGDLFRVVVADVELQLQPTALPRTGPSLVALEDQAQRPCPQRATQSCAPPRYPENGEPPGLLPRISEVCCGSK